MGHPGSKRTTWQRDMTAYHNRQRRLRKIRKYLQRKTQLTGTALTEATQALEKEWR